ncbi:hypothetical protein MMC07_002679 [Pseudocyphellaria aurata]|nr:hypothetical protein [Pseudocyphellaria aurata]
MTLIHRLATLLLTLTRFASSFPQDQDNKDLIAFGYAGDSAISAGNVDPTNTYPIAFGPTDNLAIDDHTNNPIDLSGTFSFDLSNSVSFSPIALNQDDVTGSFPQSFITSQRAYNTFNDEIPPEGPPLCDFSKQLHRCIWTYRILWCKSWQAPSHPNMVRRARTERDACTDDNNFYCCTSNEHWVAKKRVGSSKDWGEGQECDKVLKKKPKSRNLLDRFLEWLRRDEGWELPGDGSIPIPDIPGGGS